MRQIIIAGNWKMNKGLFETEQFCKDLVQFATTHHEERVRMIIAPAFPFLKIASTLLLGQPVGISAQDVSSHEDGAFTGEISASMLSSLEMQYCIIGHSERRQYHQESDISVRDKQLILREYGIKPILCIGETLAQRDANETSAVLISQLQGCFKDVPLESGEEVIVAYEPVWAIGTGRTASPAQAQEAHALIRNWFKENYNQQVAQAIHILYGGSVKPDNIAELISCPDIDGGLIGGAALVLDSYIQMVKTATTQIQTRN